MFWKSYEVIFRLRTPLHSGWRKVGNLQMTRPYVTGRMLWGALTMRLARDGVRGQSAVDSREYQRVGERVHETLAFTYFYPALRSGRGYEVRWLWENEVDFRRQFLGSYASTALEYPQQAAAESSLHEVEFISPYTIDDGRPVYLIGYVFERNGCSLNWRLAIRRLQLGGERGYGWGLVEPVGEPKVVTNNNLFRGAANFDGSCKRPSLIVPEKRYLLAHTRADEGLPIEGAIEPLVGREWRSTNTNNKYAGQHVEYNAVCFVPGSRLGKQMSFLVDKLGIWEKVCKR